MRDCDARRMGRATTNTRAAAKMRRGAHSTDVRGSAAMGSAANMRTTATMRGAPVRPAPGLRAGVS
jgi:hypothetical protein